MATVLVLGDDLNAPLARGTPPGADVLVINLGTRHATPSHAAEAVRAAVACLEHLNHVLATGRKNP